MMNSNMFVLATNSNEKISIKIAELKDIVETYCKDMFYSMRSVTKTSGTFCEIEFSSTVDTDLLRTILEASGFNVCGITTPQTNVTSALTYQWKKKSNRPSAIAVMDFFAKVDNE